MGRLDLDAAPVNLRTLLDFADAARRLGADFDIERWLTRPYVAGVEVTQSIQYYRAEQHLTNADDRGPDNSVRLVARKPAWVRVYVRSGIFGPSQDLTGDLVVELRTGVLLTDWSTLATLAPQPAGYVTSQRNPAYATERGTTASSLNFIVPGALMQGIMRVTARIWALDDHTRTPIDSWQETVDASLLQTLSLRGVFVTYSGPDPTKNATNPPTVNLPAPTLANLQSTAAWTLTTNPLESQGVFSSAGQMNWFAPLTGAATGPGGCSSGWQSFNFWLSLIKNNDGNRSDVIYYGLLPAATPIANVSGCELYGVSAGTDTDQQTMAHEIGHGAGLKHAPCGVTGTTVDGSYPAYEPYDPANTPTASIGEYGLDITNGTIHPPTTDKDYMSYCGPAWISLYNHAQLCGNSAFNPRTAGLPHWRPPDLVDPYLWPWEYIPDPPNWERHPGDLRAKAEALISILGTVDETGELAVRSVTRVQALRRTRDAVPTRFVAQLIGEQDEPIASAAVVRLPAQGSGCKCHGGAGGQDDGPFVFEAMLSDVAPGTELRIVERSRENRGDETVWTRGAPSRRPRISGFAVSVARGSGTATWEARGAQDCSLDFSLQFSKDAGRSWNGLAVGITTKRHRFPLTHLPSGRLIFRLLAHDGFHTATAVSRPVEIPRRLPIVSILSPRVGPPCFAGFPLRLWGAVTEDDGALADPEACSWRIDDRPAATGLDTWVTAPEPGDHRVTLTVRGRGGPAEVEVVLRTLDPADTDPYRASAPSSPETPRRGRTARKPSSRRRRR